MLVFAPQSSLLRQYMVSKHLWLDFNVVTKSRHRGYLNHHVKEKHNRRITQDK